MIKYVMPLIQSAQIIDTISLIAANEISRIQELKSKALFTSFLSTEMST